MSEFVSLWLKIATPTEEEPQRQKGDGDSIVDTQTLYRTHVAASGFDGLAELIRRWLTECHRLSWF